MTDEYLRNKLYLYQFGDGLGDYFIFPKIELSMGSNKPVKSQYEDSNFIDGAIRTNLRDRNNLGSVELSTDFIVKQSNYFDMGYLKKMFNKPLQTAYFFTVSYEGNLEMYFNSDIDCTVTVNQEVSPSSEYGQQIDKVRVGLTSGLPFVYKCKNSVSYFDFDAFDVVRLIYGGGATYGGGAKYGQASALATIALSTLTVDQKLSFFGSCEPTKPIVYTDKFFQNSTFGIQAGEELINQTLTSDTQVDLATATLLADTTADNRIYIIEITGQLSNGESVAIRNMSNDSSLEIYWEGSSSSTAIMYYSSYFDKLYQADGTEITATDYRKGQIASNFLYFSPLSSQNKVLTNTFETVRLQKNSINDLTVKIENLNTYQL